MPLAQAAYILFWLWQRQLLIMNGGDVVTLTHTQMFHCLSRGGKFSFLICFYINK